MIGSNLNRLGSLALAIVLLVGATAGAFEYVSASSTGQSISLDQCANGAVGANPAQCQDNALVTDWVNGNVNGQKAHWKESQFIAYTDLMGAITPGNHTFIFTYDTVHSGGHAIDRLGSVNATETFSTTPTVVMINGKNVGNANNNNPCTDHNSAVPAGSVANCNANISGFTSAASPVSSIPTPIEKFNGTGGQTNCGGAKGTYHGLTGSASQGKILLWGPNNSKLYSAVIQSDNTPSGTGACTTTVKVVFSNGGSSTANMIMAWGGHIASQSDWGFGNGATAVSGSPYHMAQASLDGVGGAQDRALSTSAIFYTPALTTTIYNATSGQPLAGEPCDAPNCPTPPTIPAGSRVFDGANFTLGTIDPATSATLTYKLYNVSSFGNSCNTGTQTLTTTSYPPNNSPLLSSTGQVGTSATSPKLSPGMYVYNVTFAGDAQDARASVCEPFIVGSNSHTISTQVSNSTITVGQGPVTDTAILAGSDTPTGSITFKVYYNDAACTTTSVFNSTVSVNGNGNYTSGGFTPSKTGTYRWVAAYSGDSFNNAASGACGDNGETLTVNPVGPTFSTTVSPATITFGHSATDTFHLSGGSSPTGSITFNVYYNDNSCTTTSVFTSTKAVNGNGNYTSGAFTPTKTGTYYWIANYTGDSNNNSVQGACGDFGETLTVQSIPKITQFGYTNAPTNNDPTTGNGTIVVTFKIHNYGTTTMNVTGSLGVTGKVVGTCSLPISVNISAGGDYNDSLTCSYSGTSGQTVTATLATTYKDLNNATGSISGSPATITFTIETS